MNPFIFWPLLGLFVFWLMKKDKQEAPPTQKTPKDPVTRKLCRDAYKHKN